MKCFAGRLFAFAFQSTLPRGSDRFVYVFNIFFGNFNPRSLAGATLISLAADWCSAYFNPRSLAGATLYTVHTLTSAWHFNPRSLAGATRISCANANRTAKFQSTLPRGSDPYDRVIMVDNDISIHAPSRERPLKSATNTLTARFQSTLPRGSDRRLRSPYSPQHKFQSTLPRGSD